MSVLFAVTLFFHLSASENWKQDKLYQEIPCLNTEPSTSLGNIDTRKTVVFADCGNGVFNLTKPFNNSMLSDLHITGEKASVIECSDNVGTSFRNISNLTLENLVIRNCYDPKFDGGIRIVDCIDVTLKNITVEKSWGTGLILENNMGQVIIDNCIFQNNGLGSRKYQSRYALRYYTSSRYNQYDDLHIFGGGGGMQVLIGSSAGGSVNNSSTIINSCMFLNNNARSGGGLFVVIQSRAQGNNVIIQNSNFTGNSCPDGGGGGLEIIYASENKTDTVINNILIVYDCKITNNVAVYGGGTALSSTLGSYAFSLNRVEFTRCSWSNNLAELGMAVDIAIAPWETFTRAGLFPSPVFTDCTFSNHKQPTNVRRPKCALSVTGFRLEFRGNISFRENSVTALEATSAELKFTVNSNVEFIKNQGVNGGAIKLSGLSVMLIQDNSIFIFEENTADVGGALYVESYKHSLIPSESCFIQYKPLGDEQRSPQNVFFMFINNTAGPTDELGHYTDAIYRGDSVYATTIAPCLGKCLKSSRSYLNVSDALTCIGNFSFVKPSKRHVSTAAHHFKHFETGYEDDPMCQIFLKFIDDKLYIHKNTNYSEKKTNPINGYVLFIPGKVTELPLKLIDELCGEIFFHVSVQVLRSEHGTILVDPAYTVITNNRIVLHGQPGDSGTIQLSTVDVRNIAIPVNVTLDECPPGYVLHGDVCKCSATSPKDHYHGIWRCDERQFRAYIGQGYWLGNFANSSYLRNAICPKGFCTNVTHWLWNGIDRASSERVLCPKGFCNFTANQPFERLLPSNSAVDLSIYICHPNRNSTICGTCKSKYSAYYRSKSFSCKPNDLCYLGWLFYVLTEIFPVTILFLVVIFFNISFTSGPLNGVVFFMQVVDTLKLNAENIIKVDPRIHTFASMYKLVYRVFTLSVFAVEEFSFCLWQGASALDTLAFRYVTIVYSLCLVLTTVFLLKVCNCHRRRIVVNLKRSIIHGLSAFLVMSYSECTRVSLMILTMSTVTIGPESNQHFEYRAFYNGEYSYLGPEHLTYAIPAIFFLMTLVSIPPLLLLSYPLCYKLFALLRIEESRVVQITCKIFPLEKIKPLFDSMQGTFKDHYRFFAGLYFLYRLFSLLTFTYTKTLTSYYTITGIQLLCMLVLHAICRPYKTTWHNVLDAFLLFNLAIINVATSYNYQLMVTYNTEQTIKRWTRAQVVLVLLPLVFLVIYTPLHIVKRIKAICVCKSKTHKLEIDSSNEVIDNLDTRSLDNSLVEMNDYMLLGPDPK